MKTLKKYLPSFLSEALILLLFLVMSNNFLSTRENLIEADGRGYYEFLPATFIYKDLKLSYLDTLQTEFYDDKMMSEVFYPRLKNGQRYDKYFIGTAVLQAPFFAIGHAWAKASNKHVADGFSRPYQLSIYLAALFYTFFGLVFLRLMLLSYKVNRLWIFAVQAGVILCSSLLDYIHWDAAYSHVYSFFLVSGFLYFTRSFFLNDSRKSLFWAILFLGLVFLVRPVNILILLFIPVLAEDLKDFIRSIKAIFTAKIKTTLWATLVVAVIVQIQCLTWYAQTGHWIHYAYGDETFIWSEPHITDFLFSYRKGFFLWAPWFFVLLASAILFHAFKRSWYRLTWFLVGFMLLIYVLSSWWYWSYGGSIGARPMIDFYPALVAFAAPVFAGGSRFFKWLILAVTPVLSAVMIIQVYQYQRYILTLDQMNEESYWKIFLKTEPMYELYLWKTEIPTGRQVSETLWTNHLEMETDRWYVSDTIQVVNSAPMPRTGQITFISAQKSNAEQMEIRLLGENDSLLFNHYSTMLHVVDEKKGTKFIDYRFQINKDLPKTFKAVFVILTKASPVTIDSMKIRFFTD